MFICFFDSQGMVHKEFVPSGQTVSHTFYQEVIERLRKMVARVRTAIARTWMQRHDKAPCHTAVSIIEFFAEKNHSCGSSAPYSTDLSRCDFFLFTLAPTPPQSRHFGTWIISRTA